MQKGTQKMKRSILLTVRKGSKNAQRVGSKVLRSLVKNVKIASMKINLKKINKYISNYVYIKSGKLPNYFQQRCYVKSFRKNSKSSDVTAMSYCWFVRQRFRKSASTDRSTFSMAWFPDAFC